MECRHCAAALPGVVGEHYIFGFLHGMRVHIVIDGKKRYFVYYAYSDWRLLGAFPAPDASVIVDHRSSLEWIHAMNKLIKQSRAVKSVGPGGKDYSDVAWESRWPCLHAYLTSTEGEEKKTPRLTSTLAFCVDDGRPKCVLNDREEEASLFATGNTLDDARDALEAKLSAGTPDWRSWQVKGRKKK